MLYTTSASLDHKRDYVNAYHTSIFYSLISFLQSTHIRYIRYLRQNLYANYQAALPTSPSIHKSNDGDDSEECIVSSAMRSAFMKVDREVLNVIHWSFQGDDLLHVHCSVISWSAVSCLVY